MTASLGILRGNGHQQNARAELRAERENIEQAIVTLERLAAGRGKRRRRPRRDATCLQIPDSAGKEMPIRELAGLARSVQAAGNLPHRFVESDVWIRYGGPRIADLGNVYLITTDMGATLEYKGVGFIT